MFNEKAFVSWLRTKYQLSEKNEGRLSQSSIKKYTRSISQISNFLAEKNIIRSDLYEIDDIRILKKVLKKYFDNKANKEQDERGHRQWHAATRNLIRFFEADLSSSLLEESFQSVYDKDELDRIASKLRNRKPPGFPKGNKNPKSKTQKTKVYQRDVEVYVAVLKNANGICEGCKKSAPFIKKDNIPYLEVHHVIPLKDSGEDTTDNAVALCPNCHREAHSGKKQTALTRKLKKIALSHTRKIKAQYE
jgi:predicted HNH restriction endonuclease